jgi:hypothetical protein
VLLAVGHAIAAALRPYPTKTDGNDAQVTSKPLQVFARCRLSDVEHGAELTEENGPLQMNTDQGDAVVQMGSDHLKMVRAQRSPIKCRLCC